MGNNHLKWFNEEQRKIIIICFEEHYLKSLSKALSHKEIYMNDAIGFFNDTVYYKKLSLKLWYLTVKNRHLWRHHFLGSQGVIINFSFSAKVKDNRITYEVLNILNDKHIVGLPVLLLIDTNNKDEFIVEKLRKDMNETFKTERKKIKNVRFLFVDFIEDITDLEIGLDWLAEKMQPLKI